MRASNIALSVVCGPIICVYVVFAACFCPSHLRPQPRSDDKKRFERRQRMAPRPLPLRSLERRLTIPKQSEQPLVGRTLEQSQSRLMQLPLELRQMIYRAVLGDNIMHIILKQRRLGHLRCKVPGPRGCVPPWGEFQQSRDQCWGSLDSAGLWAPSYDTHKPSHGNIVPFLQTCRQIYSEAIEYLYSTNTFSFSDLDSLRYFSCTVLPSRFAAVRKLDLEWVLHWPIYDSFVQALLFADPVLYPPYDEASWEEAWRIISEMPNLSILRASICHTHGFRNAEYEAVLLAPLRKVTRPRSFEVYVSWEDGEEIADAPFKLIRAGMDLDEVG